MRHTIGVFGVVLFAALSCEAAQTEPASSASCNDSASSLNEKLGMVPMTEVVTKLQYAAKADKPLFRFDTQVCVNHKFHDPYWNKDVELKPKCRDLSSNAGYTDSPYYIDNIPEIPDEMKYSLGRGIEATASTFVSKLLTEYVYKSAKSISTRDAIRRMGADYVRLRFDIRDNSQKLVFEWVKNKHGWRDRVVSKLEVPVNLAGIHRSLRYCSTLPCDDSEWMSRINYTLNGAFREFFDAMGI